jgi:hypothetical protein
MKESLRRVILFTVTVITGSVMILVDVPLIIMIPLILAVGFVILLLLGAITVAELKSAFAAIKLRNLRKTGILKRLDQMKFFEKNPVKDNKKPVSPIKKEESGGGNPKKTGIVTHLGSFLSSLGSLGTVLKERSRRERKVEHINELLDKAVSEKVKGSALASAGTGARPEKTSPPAAGGPGVQEPPKDQDPFLSLSGDEFDVSLLDGLDDHEASPQKSSPAAEKTSAAPAAGSDLIINEPDIPLPSLDVSSEAQDILKNNSEGSLEEFKGLDGGEAIDQDFGDLENLNLEDVDLDIDIEDEAPGTGGESAPGQGSTGTSPASNPATTVKTDWVASDAPKNADILEKEVSTQDDMAAFAGGATGTDEDLLSSLASDVKKTTKEKNISLLRDLKDFKAPATDIEHELKEMFDMMKTSTKTVKKGISPAKELK